MSDVGEANNNNNNQQQFQYNNGFQSPRFSDSTTDPDLIPDFSNGDDEENWLSGNSTTTLENIHIPLSSNFDDYSMVQSPMYIMDDGTTMSSYPNLDDFRGLKNDMNDVNNFDLNFISHEAQTMTQNDNISTDAITELKITNDYNQNDNNTNVCSDQIILQNCQNHDPLNNDQNNSNSGSDRDISGKKTTSNPFFTSIIIEPESKDQVDDSSAAVKKQVTFDQTFTNNNSYGNQATPINGLYLEGSCEAHESDNDELDNDDDDDDDVENNNIFDVFDDANATTTTTTGSGITTNTQNESTSQQTNEYYLLQFRYDKLKADYDSVCDRLKELADENAVLRETAAAVAAALDNTPNTTYQTTNQRNIEGLSTLDAQLLFSTSLQNTPSATLPLSNSTHNTPIDDIQQPTCNVENDVDVYGISGNTTANGQQQNINRMSDHPPSYSEVEQTYGIPSEYISPSPSSPQPPQQSKLPGIVSRKTGKYKKNNNKGNVNILPTIRVASPPAEPLSGYRTHSTTTTSGAISTASSHVNSHNHDNNNNNNNNLVNNNERPIGPLLDRIYERHRVDIYNKKRNNTSMQQLFTSNQFLVIVTLIFIFIFTVLFFGTASIGLYLKDSKQMKANWETTRSMVDAFQRLSTNTNQTARLHPFSPQPPHHHTYVPPYPHHSSQIIPTATPAGITSRESNGGNNNNNNKNYNNNNNNNNYYYTHNTDKNNQSPLQYDLATLPIPFNSEKYPDLVTTDNDILSHYDPLPWTNNNINTHSPPQQHYHHHHHHHHHHYHPTSGDGTLRGISYESQMSLLQHHSITPDMLLTTMSDLDAHLCTLQTLRSITHLGGQSQNIDILNANTNNGNNNNNGEDEKQTTNDSFMYWDVYQFPTTHNMGADDTIQTRSFILAPNLQKNNNYQNDENNNSENLFNLIPTQYGFDMTLPTPIQSDHFNMSTQRLLTNNDSSKFQNTFVTNKEHVYDSNTICPTLHHVFQAQMYGALNYYELFKSVIAQTYFMNNPAQNETDNNHDIIIDNSPVVSTTSPVQSPLQQLDQNAVLFITISTTTSQNNSVDKQTQSKTRLQGQILLANHRN